MIDDFIVIGFFMAVGFVLCKAIDRAKRFFKGRG